MSENPKPADDELTLCRNIWRKLDQQTPPMRTFVLNYLRLKHEESMQRQMAQTMVNMERSFKAAAVTGHGEQKVSDWSGQVSSETSLQTSSNGTDPVLTPVLDSLPGPAEETSSPSEEPKLARPHNWDFPEPEKTQETAPAAN